MDVGHSLFMSVTLCLDTSLTFFLLVHMHLTSVDLWKVFGPSTALTSLKFPYNLNNLFASNKARLLKPIFHTWLSFFLTSHWYWIPAVFFWSYLKSWPQLCELWLHCLPYQDKDAQQTAHLRKPGIWLYFRFQLLANPQALEKKRNPARQGQFPFRLGCFCC